MKKPFISLILSLSFFFTKAQDPEAVKNRGVVKKYTPVTKRKIDSLYKAGSLQGAPYNRDTTATRKFTEALLTETEFPVSEPASKNESLPVLTKRKDIPVPAIRKDSLAGKNLQTGKKKQ